MEYILETPRLLLRKIEVSDEPEIRAILQDIEVMYAWEHAFSDAEVSAWIQENLMRYEQDRHGYWAVLEREKHRLIGLCGILTETDGKEFHTGIGYIFGKSCWHRGYAFESAHTCVEYAFRRMGAVEMTAQIRPENISSRKLAERLGMTVKKRFTKRYRGKDMPHLLYGCAKDAFPLSPRSGTQL